MNKSNGRQAAVVQAFAYTKYLGKIRCPTLFSAGIELFFRLSFDDSGHLTGWSGDPVLLDKNVVEDAKVRIPDDNYSSGSQPILLSDSSLCTTLVALHSI